MSAACPHEPAESPGRRSVQAALAAAQSKVVAEGGVWTEPRRRTYELLIAAGRPRKAYELIAAYDPAGRAAPPTVYRALDFLISAGLVHRLESEGAFVACGHPDEAHTAQFVICECCGRSVEIAVDALGMAAALAAPLGYQVHRAILEVRGRCPICR